MFYVKEKLSDAVEVTVEITDENVFTRCPGCGDEVSIDLMQQCQSMGRRMSAFCRMNGFEIKTCLTNDDRFPSVNSYPVTAWERFMRHTGEQPRIGRNSYHA